MDPALRHHRPSERVRAQAEAQGIDLEAMKLEDPARYKMLTAEPVAAAHPELLAPLADVCMAAFRHYDFYRLELGPRRAELRSFPPLTPAEFAKLDDALGRLVEIEPYRGAHAYYRILSDRRGERRQLELPLAPEAWRGEIDTLIGPFPDPAAAEAWLSERAAPQEGRLGDSIAQGGLWYVEFFSAEV